MNANGLAFSLYDAAQPDEVRIVVSLDWPTQRPNAVGIDSMYACSLVVGPEGMPACDMAGFSPIEALAFALAVMDSTIRLEHERAPLVWGDGRAYGGDYDVPIMQIIEPYTNVTRTLVHELASARGIDLTKKKPPTGTG